MTNFVPQFQIAPRANSHVVGLILPSCPELTVVPVMASVYGDLIQWRVEPVAEAIRLTNGTEKTTVATLQFADHLSADGRTALCRSLDNALASAFTQAVFAQLQNGVPAAATPTPVASVAGVPELAGGVLAAPAGGRLRRAGRWMRTHKAATLVALVAVCGGSLAAHGYLTKPAAQDPFGFSVSSADQQRLQEMVRERVKQANGGANLGTMDGESVAIGTMKAMGLEPGKASAGCLVGVKQ
jgi:hypothetical protein